MRRSPDVPDYLSFGSEWEVARLDEEGHRRHYWVKLTYCLIGFLTTLMHLDHRALQDVLILTQHNLPPAGLWQCAIQLDHSRVTLQSRCYITVSSWLRYSHITAVRSWHLAEYSTHKDTLRIQANSRKKQLSLYDLLVVISPTTTNRQWESSDLPLNWPRASEHLSLLFAFLAVADAR